MILKCIFCVLSASLVTFIVLSLSGCENPEELATERSILSAKNYIEVCINETKYLVYSTYSGQVVPVPKYVKGKLEICE